MNLPIAALLMLAGSAMAQAVKPEAYDPLKVSGVEIVTKTFVVHDAKRTCDLPLRVYLPASPKPPTWPSASAT